MRRSRRASGCPSLRSRKCSTRKLRRLLERRAMATTATQIRNFVAGEERDGAQYGTEPILNPATEEEIAVAPKSGEEDVNAAVRAAYDAFDGWASTTPGERARALLHIADAL